MRYIQGLSILLLLHTSAISVFSQKPHKYLGKTSIEFKTMQSGFPLKTFDFKIALSEGILTLKITGEGMLQLKTGEKLPIKILLEKRDQITAIQYGVDDKFLYLLFEVYDGEGAGSKISKLYRDTLEILWTNALHGFNCFNSGESLGTRKFVYVTSTGFIGKIDLETGKFIWKHGNEIDIALFNSFKKPEKVGNKIIFTKDTNTKGTPYQIIVDDSSGEILKNTSH